MTEVGKWVVANFINIKYFRNATGGSRIQYKHDTISYETFVVAIFLQFNINMIA